MITTVKDIVAQLNQRAEDYARWLLPNGKRVNSEWEVGSIDGEAGKSLKVKLTGEKTGVWADFSGNDSGDLIGLTKQVRGVTVAEAIRIAKEWLGIRDPESVVPKKTYKEPKPKGIKKLEDNGAVYDYLCEKRGINIFTQLDFKIAQSEGPNGPEIVFPYIGPDGTLVNVKRLALKRTEAGKKLMSQEAGCAPSLFGWKTIKPDSREVIICEGEIDCCTWFQMGFPALSVPDGAGGETWIDYEWENLQQFDRIWLNFDSDNPGQKAVKSIARRLGFARCFNIVIQGFKDANEALVAGKEESFFGACIAGAKPFQPEAIKSPSDYTDRVIDKFYPPDAKAPGFFSLMFKEKLGMRPGEVTIWTGVSGHGKSVLLSQLMLEAIMIGNKVAIGSFEMLGEQTLHRMLCQSERSNTIARENIRPMLSWLGGQLWIYDLLGNVSPKLVLELLEYSYTRHGVNIFVIDSLMKCAVGSEDYDLQRTFMNDLCSFAKDTRTHVNLVAHARKGKDEADQPGKLDVKGSSDIINQADNILTVWRNKPKEEKRYKGVITEGPDAIVFCNKQRENGEEFTQNLTFMKPIYTFGSESGTMLDISILKEINPPQESGSEEYQQQNLGET